MRLKMKMSLGGPEVSLVKGDEHDFDEVEGQRLVDAGYADLVAPAELPLEETPAERVSRLEAELAEARAAVPAETPQEGAPATETPQDEASAPEVPQNEAPTEATPPTEAAPAPKKPAAKKA